FPIGLREGLECDFILPEITEGAVHAPAHPTVLVVRPSQERVSRGRRSNLPEGHGSLSPDRPELVVLQGGRQAFNRLGISDELPEVAARFDPRPERTRVREL